MRKPLPIPWSVLTTALVVTLAICTLPPLMAQLKARGANGPAAVAASRASNSLNGYPLHFRDAFAREVTLPAAPQRLISMAPSLTELVFALGAGDRLVADTAYCIHPPEAATKEKIGGITDPNMEKILGLRPDLVIGSGLTLQEVVGQIDRLGLRSAYFQHTDIASVYRDAVELATLLGVRDRGEQLVAGMRARGDELAARLKALPPAPKPKVLLLLRIDGLYSAGKGSFPHELIELAGGQNVAAQATSMWPQLSMETILRSNPDVILVAVGQGKVEAPTLQKYWQQLRADPRWKRIKAVANNRLVPVVDDLLTIPGPRLMEALEAVAAGLHPELAAPKSKLAAKP